MIKQDLPWFRFYKEAINDAKLKLIAYEDRWHFVALLCCKAQGLLDSDDRLMMRKLSIKMELPLSELHATLTRIANVGLIEHGTWRPTPYALSRILWTTALARPAAHVWRKIRDFIFRRDDYTCTYCSKRGVQLECDHVIPVSRGGSSEPDNLATACRPCNRSKRDKLVSEWRAS